MGEDMKTLEWLYGEAFRVSKMISGTNIPIERCIKFNGFILSKAPRFDKHHEYYEFALCIIENTPIFRGTEIFSTINRNKGRKLIVESFVGDGFISVTDGGMFRPEDCTLYPPKPKKLMVELDYETVLYFSNLTLITDSHFNNPYTDLLSSSTKAMGSI